MTGVAQRAGSTNSLRRNVVIRQVVELGRYPSPSANFEREGSIARCVRQRIDADL